jgi:hypothetical protein
MNMFLNVCEAHAAYQRHEQPAKPRRLVRALFRTLLTCGSYLLQIWSMRISSPELSSFLSRVSASGRQLCWWSRI